MLRVKVILLTTAMIATQWCAAPTAEAGPLLDWLRGLRRRPCNTCFQQPITYQPTSYTGVANPYNLQPGQCARTCNQTCSRVVVNYVPYTAYRTNWKRVPVTQYRPETNTDPCTGCTVTCMKPCTTYNWQMQRVPYTTYRPVYRTENYTVPVTTITNGCATGTCGPCNTCTTGLPTTGVLPQSSSVIAPNGTVGTTGGYQVTPGASVPTYAGGNAADAAPFINSTDNPQNSQRPIIDRIETLPVEGSSTRARVPTPVAPTAAPNNNVHPIQQSAPAVINYGNQTAMNPVRKKWDYTVKLASYTSTEVVEEEAAFAGPTKMEGTYIPPQPKAQSSMPAKVNSAWKTVEW